MNWKSSYKLSLNFIIFFVLVFFLIGEQLPALPIYLGWPHGDSNKVHILDLPAGDKMHRPAAYLIIATADFLLLRFLSWPLAWLIAGSLWTIDQVFIGPGEPGKILSFTTSFTISAAKIMASIWGFISWGILGLSPYFLYRWVDKKWGGRGIKKAILILFLTNLVLFSFFALQIYLLHNSHFGLQEKHFNDNYQNTSGSLPSSVPRLPAKTCPEKLTEEQGKKTVALWNGQILEVAGDDQNWVEKNCPGVLEKP